MEFRESYPTMTDAPQLGHVGFSREQIAGLERVKALYQRLSAGSTSRVAWKAKPRPQRMYEGGWGVENATASGQFCAYTGDD